MINFEEINVCAFTSSAFDYLSPCYVCQTTSYDNSKCFYPPPGALSIRNASAVSTQPLIIDFGVEWINTGAQSVQFRAQVRVGPSTQSGTITLAPGESTGIIPGIIAVSTPGTYDVFFEALAVATLTPLIPPTIISVTVAGVPPPPPPPGPQFGDISISLFSAVDAGALSITATANYTNNRSDISISVDMVVDVLTQVGFLVTGAQLPQVLPPGQGVTFGSNLQVPISGTYIVRWSAFESVTSLMLATMQEVNVAV